MLRWHVCAEAGRAAVCAAVEHSSHTSRCPPLAPAHACCAEGNRPARRIMCLHAARRSCSCKLHLMTLWTSSYATMLPCCVSVRQLIMRPGSGLVPHAAAITKKLSLRLQVASSIAPASDTRTLAGGRQFNPCSASRWLSRSSPPFHRQSGGRCRALPDQCAPAPARKPRAGLVRGH